MINEAVKEPGCQMVQGKVACLEHKGISHLLLYCMSKLYKGLYHVQCAGITHAATSTKEEKQNSGKGERGGQNVKQQRREGSTERLQPLRS